MPALHLHSLVSDHRVVVVVRRVEDRVVEGRSRAVGPLRRTVNVLLPLAAQDLLERHAHLLVPVRVNDGVHGRVKLSKEEEELLVSQNVTIVAENVQ